MEAACAATEELIQQVWSTYWSGSPDQVGFNMVVGSDLLRREDFISRKEPSWEWLLDGSVSVVDDVKL
jgi:hypothetical protein